MAWKSGLVAVILTVCAGPAASVAADDRPLFTFRGEIPVPGGTVRLEAGCAEGVEGLTCRAGTRGPSGQGFQLEGRFRFLPPSPPEVEKTGPSQSAPQWF